MASQDAESITLLGLVCSPRRLGNSELLIKEVSSRLTLPHKLELARLPSFRILPCSACYTCLFREGCVQQDDLPLLLDALCRADALVVSAPTYFLGPNAALKNLLDRGLSFYSHADSLWGKPALGAAIAGIPGKEGYTKLAVESFLQCLLADIRASEVFYAALPGELLQEEENLDRIQGLTSALEGKSASSSGICPVCGGDSFRFLSRQMVRCLLCGSEGGLEHSQEGVSVDLQTAGHEMFGDREKALRHLRWLQGMKDRFREKRRELLALARAYKGTGEWIEPK